MRISVRGGQRGMRRSCRGSGQCSGVYAVECGQALGREASHAFCEGPRHSSCGETELRATKVSLARVCCGPSAFVCIAARVDVRVC